MSDVSQIYRSPWDCVKKTYHEGGVAAFYRVSTTSLLLISHRLPGIPSSVLEDRTLHRHLLCVDGTRENASGVHSDIAETPHLTLVSMATLTLYMLRSCDGSFDDL